MNELIEENESAEATEETDDDVTLSPIASSPEAKLQKHAHFYVYCAYCSSAQSKY